MRVTPKMMEATRRAEYDYYQKGTGIGSGRFIPTPDPIIRAMLQAALGVLDPEPPEPPGGGPRKPPAVVTAYKPRRRRG
jgi:hypothetical protein